MIDFRKLREYENLHIALWLLKDTCWLMEWKIGGLCMIVPTIGVALHITWLSRKALDELLHNIAVCFWINANAIWMIGEFFYDDGLRPFSRLFFALGLSVLVIYYLVVLPRRKLRNNLFKS